jgi:plasmid stabilization system protein ParE
MRTVKLSDRAKADLRDIQIHLTDYSEAIAEKHVVRLAHSIDLIGTQPFLWAYFFLTGAPYRAKLFFIGKTSFWVVYELDESEQAVNILRIWNCKQNPEDFEL